MGQYYKPCFLDKDKKEVKKWVYSHDYDSGLKLMEHSWFLNEFVGAVESQLIPGGKYHKTPIVWAGDYADEEEGTKINLYDKATDKNKLKPKATVLDDTYRYIINHDKKLYVDKTKIANNDGWRIHPLPLLTCEGNGRGGGDYRGEEPIVGSWARDVISVESEMPKDYDEILFTCVE
jgi:hypothetical protein